MGTPTVTRVSLEPFCPACGGGLEAWGEFISWTMGGTDVVHVITVDLPCPGCGKALELSDVAWREREKEEA